MRNDRMIKGALYAPLSTGFDLVEKTRADWQELMATESANGGWRRAEDGDTFIHGADGRIVAEVWEIVPEKRSAA
jgi:hypothetical protein